MKFISLFATVLFTFSAQAGDVYQFRSLGFSSDGSKYAYLQHVVMDGSGFPRAQVTVMDVAAGNELRNETVVLRSENAAEQDAIDAALLQADLPSFGIVGDLEGSLLLNRLNSDRSDYTNNQFATGYFRTYDLKVTATAVPSPVSYCYADSELLQLTLTGDDPSAPLSSVLINESSLSADRECAHNYRVSKVIYAPQSLVVIMAYQSAGFEGPDVNFLAVVKQIELE